MCCGYDHRLDDQFERIREMALESGHAPVTPLCNGRAADLSHPDGHHAGIDVPMVYHRAAHAWICPGGCPGIPETGGFRLRRRGPY